MEQLLHYVWKHKLFPLRQLTTTDGESVEVIDSGLHNHNAGPDFFNAKVKIGDTVWVGNVEIHDRSSDWFAHHHDTDDAYNNVILHVASIIDTTVKTHDGRPLPQLQLDVPQQVSEHYEQLLHEDKYPPCHQIISELPRLKISSWLSALQTERLEQKTQAIMKRLKQCNGSWEAAYFATLARNFGFGINGEAFEQWAQNIPLNSVAHHSDELFQIEALFLGQAGLLDEESIPERYREEAHKEGYFSRIHDEYKYLAHKFALKPIDWRLWRFLRLRPQNFPHIRIAQLAQLYFNKTATLSQIVECDTLKELQEALRTTVTPYWQTHYLFGEVSKKSDKKLSDASINLIILNTVVPVLFAYGRYQMDDNLCEKAFTLLDQLPAERNHIVSMWQECGLEATSAGHTQALIQLKKEYCDRKDCLRCRFGYEYLKRI